MGIPSTPPPVAPRDDAERAADAAFYRREHKRPHRAQGRGFDGWLLGLGIALIAFIVGD